MKKRYSEEPIIKAIKQHEAGARVDDIFREPGISNGTFYNWRSRYALSERVACRLVGLSRTACRYKPVPKNDQAVRERLKMLAAQHSRYGYVLLHALLKAEGLVINKNRTCRLYTGEGLQVRTRKRQKLQ